MPSLNWNTNEAVAEIRVLKTEEEVLAFIEGDNRKTVVDYAMTKIDSIRRVNDAKENEEVAAKEVPRATQRIWLYHSDIEPRLFEVGEEIPEGWSEKNTAKWFRNPKIGLRWAKP